MAICIALCFAEVAGYFEKNGAAYIYVKETFGEFWGFEIGMISWIAQILVWATVAKVFSEILHEMYSQINENLLACALIILLGIINLLGVKSAKYLNNFFSIAKILVLFTFVIVGAFFIKKANFEPFVGEYFSSNDTISTLSISFLFIFYVFCGFENIAMAAKDMQNPKRNLPIAIITVMLCLPFIYTLIQCVCVGILGSDLAETKLPLPSFF